MKANLVLVLFLVVALSASVFAESVDIRVTNAPVRTGEIKDLDDAARDGIDYDPSSERVIVARDEVPVVRRTRVSDDTVVRPMPMPGDRGELLRSRLESEGEAQVEGEGVVVSVRPTRISVEGEDVPADGQIIRVNVGGGELMVRPDGSNVLLEDGDIVAVSDSEVSIEPGVVRVNGVEIMAPSQAIKREDLDNARDVRITIANDKPVYVVSSEEERRLLGVFRVSVRSDVTVAADSGVVVDKRRPWWGFLTI